MAPIIKNVAIVGAAGSLGSVIFKKLLSAGVFNVRVLRRVGSKSTFPSGISVVDIDYDSPASLKAALDGQDAIVVTLAGSFADELPLIDAAVAAGVQRFIPSSFGSDLDNANTRQLPVFADKKKTHEKLVEVSQNSDLSYTEVYNSAFLDWGLEKDFLLRISDYKPQLIDGGDLPFSATTLGSVADAVVGILKNPEGTKNKALFIHDLVITQNQLLTMGKRVAPGKPWEPQVVKLDDLISGANERLAKGLYDMETFVPFLWQAVMGPGYGGKFERVDNELLGLKGKTEEDVVEILKELIH